MQRPLISISCLGLLALTTFVSAQPAPSLSASAKKAILERAAKVLAEKYVFADVAERLAKGVQSHLASGKYDRITEPKAFAKAVEDDLRAVAKDVHLSFFFDPRLYAQLTGVQREDPEAVRRQEEETRQRERYLNYGFNRLERLDGNVGYLDLTGFSELVGEDAGTVGVGAMAFLAGADAVIIDIRRNPGGSGRMGQMLATYFFSPDDEQWLVSNQNRSAGTFRQEWTQPFVPGRRLVGVDLYILIGPGTGSAAEGFAYNLQALKRATVVGAKSAGGAHSGSYAPLTEGFVMFLPTGRTVNPVTNANWEGTGVTPDIAVDPAKALAQAHLLAMEKIKARPSTKEQGVDAEWLLMGLRAEVSPVTVPAALLRSYLGAYQLDNTTASVTMENGSLFYTIKGGKRYPLVPLSEDTFLVQGHDRYGPQSRRGQFVRDEAGRVVKMITQIRHAPGQIARFEDARLP